MKKFKIYFWIIFSALFFNACQSELNDEQNIINNTIKEETAIQDNITGLTKVDVPDGISQVDIYNIKNY